MQKFPPNFSRREFELSQTAIRGGIDNAIPEDLLPNTVRLSWWLQELRNKINRIHRTDSKARELPIIVTSGYRSPALNKAIGGSTTSQHMKAEAADFNVPGMTARELVDFIVKHHPGFDQMIEEFGQWVHVSVVADKPRGEVLVARKSGGKTTYAHLKQDSK